MVRRSATIFKVLVSRRTATVNPPFTQCVTICAFCYDLVNYRRLRKFEFIHEASFDRLFLV
jgi:hypothetical protein